MNALSSTCSSFFIPETYYGYVSLFGDFSLNDYLKGDSYLMGESSLKFGLRSTLPERVFWLNFTFSFFTISTSIYELVMLATVAGDSEITDIFKPNYDFY